SGRQKSFGKKTMNHQHTFLSVRIRERNPRLDTVGSKRVLMVHGFLSKTFLTTGFFALGLVVTSRAGGAETSDAGVVRDPLAVQHARTVSLAGKGKKAFYTKRWDLGDLPEYVPGAKVSGT